MLEERGNALFRALDARLGPPLVLCAGLFKGRGRPPEHPASLAALCLGCIGDAILLSGPLGDLARTHPGCRITLFATAANAAAARMIPAVAEVVALPLERPLDAAMRLRAAGPFDALLDFGQWPRISALFAALARAPFKAGFRTPGQHRHFAFHGTAEHRADRHEIDNFRALVGLLGAEGRSAPTIVPPPAPPGGEPMPGRPFAILHPFPGGTRAAMKEWPEDRWLALARHLRDRGLAVLFSGGPSDAARAARLAGAAGDQEIQSAAGAPLDRTARLLQQAALTVSVNTGIMHLAAALGTPLAALHGPTSVLRWGPLGAPERTISLGPARGCSACLHLGFEYGCRDNACMRAIDLESVAQAADRLLEAPGKAAP